LNRRNFIKRSAAITGGLALSGFGSTLLSGSNNFPFKISLAEWSLHRALGKKEINHLDFAAIAKKEFGISAVEYVNTFFFEKANDYKYLSEMKKRVDDLGSKSLLIMCDNEGNLGDPDNKKRAQAIENHYKWTEAAKYLGCHSIRVNARSEGSWDDQIKLAADGLHRLGEPRRTFIQREMAISSYGKSGSSKGGHAPGFRQFPHPRRRMV